MLWIKATLLDPAALLKQGYDKKTKSYSDNRRVALVKGNYVVVIRFIKKRVAKFVTAFEISEEESLGLFIDGPDWLGKDKWL